MKIRLFQEKDINQIADLFYRCVHNVCKDDYTPEALEAWAPKDMDILRLKASLQKNHTLVVEDNEEVVAFGDMGDTGYIDRLYVREDYLGQGIGRQLLDRFEKYARVKGIIYINTSASITSLDFFKTMGYDIVAKQMVERRGVRIKRFLMEKKI